MVVVARGIITDGLRSMALAQGYTAFGSSTMMQNKFCNFLTASRFSRAVYGVAKVLAFLMVIIAHIPNIESFTVMSEYQYGWYCALQPNLILTADILVYITVAMCIIRGIPVLFESKRFINNENNEV